MAKKHGIGLSKKVEFIVDPTRTTSNSIKVFADIPAGTAVKAYLSSSSHFWDQPTNTTVTTDNVVTITAFCLRRKKRKNVGFTKTSGGDGDEDLSVTLVYDDGTGSPELDEVTFGDVDYDH